MRILKSKRAQEGGTNMYMIALIVALVLLVLVIYAFTQNWAGMKDKFNQLAGGSSNLDSVRTGCSTTCNSGEASNYNDYMRDVIFPDGFKTKATCQELEGSIGACMNSQNTLINGVLTQADCEGATVNGKKAVWTAKVCYKTADNGIVTGVSDTATCTKANTQDTTSTNIQLFKDNGCVVDTKIVLTANTKAKCEGQGVWVLNKEAAVITTACTNPQVI